jgi:hypothetical protein
MARAPPVFRGSIAPHRARRCTRGTIRTNLRRRDRLLGTPVRPRPKRAAPTAPGTVELRNSTRSCHGTRSVALATAVAFNRWRSHTRGRSSGASESGTATRCRTEPPCGVENISGPVGKASVFNSESASSRPGFSALEKILCTMPKRLGRRRTRVCRPDLGPPIRHPRITKFQQLIDATRAWMEESTASSIVTVLQQWCHGSFRL